MEITRVNNGFIVKEQDETFVFSENDSNEVENMVELLRFIHDCLGPSTGRNSESRIYINIHPGDKREEFYTRTCPLCYRSSQDE